MLDEFVGSTVVSVLLVLDVLTHLFERLPRAEIVVLQFLHDLLVDLVVLGVHMLHRDEVEVFWQVLLVPRVLLDLSQRYPLYRVGLQHAINQVLHTVRNVVGDEVTALLDLAEELRHLVVVEGKRAADHGIQDDAT